MATERVPPRRVRAPAGLAMTIALPSIALPEVHVHAPAPALVSPDVNPEHVGLTKSGLQDVLRAMRADPRWAPRLIALSRKRVAAAPADVIEFMRERYAAPAAPTGGPSNDAGGAASGVDAVLGLVGCERVRRGGRGA